MTCSSRVAWVAFGIMLALASAGQSSARVLGQEEPQPASQQSDKASEDSTAATDKASKKASPSQNAKSGSSKSKQKSVGNRQSGQAIKSSKDTASSAGPADKTSSAQQPLFQTLAKQNLQSFDAAISVAQRAEVSAPGAWQKKSGDSFVAKRSELQSRADAAKDEQAWAGIATDAAAALTDVLKAVASKPCCAGAPAKSALPTDARPVGDGNPHELKALFWRSNLPLLLAGMSLLVSLVSLWRGWFFTRRQINKALVEAGLL